MEKLKMCSFRLESELFTNFKDFCTRNKVTIKGSLTKVIELLLEAEVNENDQAKM